MKLKFQIRLPLYLLTSIYFILYLDFIRMHVIPNYIKGQIYDLNFLSLIETSKKNILIAFHCLLGLSIWCMLKAFWTSPGRTPDSWHMQMQESVCEHFLKEQKGLKGLNESGGNFYNVLGQNIVKEVYMQSN